MLDCGWAVPLPRAPQRLLLLAQLSGVSEDNARAAVASRPALLAHSSAAMRRAVSEAQAQAAAEKEVAGEQGRR
jgi:hypothetical protein